MKIQYRLMVLAVLFMFISAITICPVMAEEVKNSVTIDDFNLQQQINSINELTKDPTCQIYRYCIRDDTCWSSLDQSTKAAVKKKCRSIFERVADIAQGNASETLDEWRERNCEKHANCNLNKQGWVGRPVIMTGELQVETITDAQKNTFRGIMRFTPDSVSVYNNRFYLFKEYKKTRILFDRTINTNSASDNERKFMELIQNIVSKKKEADFNDLGIIFDTSRIIVGGALTANACLSIPATTGVGALQCINGVGNIMMSIGDLSNKIKTNDELELQIKDYAHVILKEEKEDL